MNKNYLIFALLATFLSSCDGNYKSSKTTATRTVDPSPSINSHTGIVTRNIGEANAAVNQYGKTLPN